MISVEDVLQIHERLIKEFGGTTGLRDINLLESALKRPYAGLMDMELYPSPEIRAAVLIESIIKNHPFIDGNKRTGYVLMRLFLRMGMKDILTDEDSKYQFVIDIASGKSDTESIARWITEHIVDI